MEGINGIIAFIKVVDKKKAYSSYVWLLLAVENSSTAPRMSSKGTAGVTSGRTAGVKKKNRQKSEEKPKMRSNLCHVTIADRERGTSHVPPLAYVTHRHG